MSTAAETGTRVLVTGSRNWINLGAVVGTLRSTLASVDNDRLPFVVVHGDCPTGADHMASQWVRDMRAAGWGDVREEPHPADWKRLGKRAGFARNAEMVDLGADLCLAFVRDNSAGASHTASLAAKAGITVRRFEQ